jgi:hypothetical protein
MSGFGRDGVSGDGAPGGYAGDGDRASMASRTRIADQLEDLEHEAGVRQQL